MTEGASKIELIFAMEEKDAPEEVTEMYGREDRRDVKDREREGGREKDRLGSTRNIERGCKEDRARASGGGQNVDV